MQQYKSVQVRCCCCRFICNAMQCRERKGVCPRIISFVLLFLFPLPSTSISLRCCCFVVICVCAFAKWKGKLKQDSLAVLAFLLIFFFSLLLNWQNHIYCSCKIDTWLICLCVRCAKRAKSTNYHHFLISYFLCNDRSRQHTNSIELQRTCCIGRKRKEKRWEKNNNHFHITFGMLEFVHTIQTDSLIGDWYNRSQAMKNGKTTTAQLKLTHSLEHASQVDICVLKF